MILTNFVILDFFSLHDPGINTIANNQSSFLNRPLIHCDVRDAAIMILHQIWEKEMLRMLLLVASVALLASAPCQGEIIAYWDFNSFDPSADTSLAADIGAGTIDISSWDGDVDDFGGSSINRVGDSAAGNSLSLVGDDGNGSFVEISTSLSGYEDPVITFATRGTGTGFDSGTWSWSTDGLTFTDLEGANTASRSTSYSLATADFSGVNGLADASNAFFRYTLDGATTAGGNNRIDNFQINASGASITAVPEPGPAAMLSLAVAVAAIGARMRHGPAKQECVAFS